MAAEEISKPPSLPPYPEVLNFTLYFPFIYKKGGKVSVFFTVLVDL
jgi:hypothetical protein